MNDECTHSHPEPDATAVVCVIVILITVLQVLLTAVVPTKHCLDFLRHGHHLGPHATEAGRVLLDPLKIFQSQNIFLHPHFHYSY